MDDSAQPHGYDSTYKSNIPHNVIESDENNSSYGDSRDGMHSNGAGHGRFNRPTTETSPLINNNPDVNPYVISFTLNRRNLLCVIISTIVGCAAIATGLSIFICNKDHDNVTQAHCLPWSSWSQCSATCGVGVQTRTNQCYGNSTQPWQATFTDSKECVERICDAYCLPWSSWSMCSVTCGEGVQKRTRQCSGNSTKPWQITFTDSTFCTEPICLGEWLQWGVWGSCSSTCGCGVKTRERGCSESYCGTNNTDDHICEKNAICKGSSFKPLNIGVMIVLLLSIKQLIQFNFT